MDIEWAPFLLDPSIPAEGRQRTPQTNSDSPKSALEERGEREGIEFRRGRTFTPNSHLALELAEYASEQGDPERVTALHRALFRANFTDFDDLSDPEVLVRLGVEAGYDEAALRDVLESRPYREQVDQGVEWARAVGVTGIPTFILNDRYAVVGAQEYEAFEQVLTRLGTRRKDGSRPPGAGTGLDDFA